MTTAVLHEHIRRAVLGVVSSEHARGLRLLLESGSSEDFLRDLLVIELTTAGYIVAREYPCLTGRVDLALPDHHTYVEAKQLHLKDGSRYVSNAIHDLKRHTHNRCLGVVYIL